MATDTVIVTGGNGRIGQETIAELNEHGYRTVNVDLDPAMGSDLRELENATADEYVCADLLDAGEVYGTVALHDADAIVHLGTIITANHDPGYKTYQSNVMTTYHLLEVARELDIETVCLASSINAVGYSYQDVPTEIDYLPFDETHRATPRDPYALGKYVAEITADGFARADDSPRTLSSFRFPWVATTAEIREQLTNADRSLEAIREMWEPDAPTDDLFAYVHVRDAARIIRHAVEAEFDGHEAFMVSAEDTMADVPTETLIDEFHPDVERRTEFTGTETIVSIEKAKRLLDWEPEITYDDL